MKRWILRLLVVAAPVLLSVIALIALRYGPLDNEQFSLRASALLSDWLLLLGVVISLGLGAGLLLWRWRDRVAAQRLSAQRKQSATERRRFLQRLDHELKNPLTAMRAGLANLSSSALDSGQTTTLQSIEAQAIRLSRLTADLRKIADLETRPLECRPVDLAALLDEAVELVREQPGATERRVTLSTPQAPWPLPTVDADWDLMFLAIYNLLDNAVKFTRAGDAVEIRAREEGDRVVVEIADTGPGIAAAEQPHVWAELYRAEQMRGIAGSGLGLALVRAIVKRHGGEVALASREGQGTSITVHLPIAPVTNR